MLFSGESVKGVVFLEEVYIVEKCDYIFGIYAVSSYICISNLYWNEILKIILMKEW